MKKIIINIILLFGLLVGCDFKTADEYFNDACKKEEQGDFIGAISDLDMVIKKKPNDIEAYVNRGVNKKVLGRYVEALKDFNKILDLDSFNIMALYNRGNTYSEMEKFEKSLHDYNKAIEYKQDYNLSIGIKEYYSDSRSSDVEMEAILLQRGLSYAELGEYQKAFTDFSYCIDKKYGYDLAYLWRGVCYFNLGDLEKGCEDWRTASDFGMKEAEKYLEEHCK